MYPIIVVIPTKVIISPLVAVDVAVTFALVVLVIMYVLLAPLVINIKLPAKDPTPFNRTHCPIPTNEHKNATALSVEIVFITSGLLTVVPVGITIFIVFNLVLLNAGGTYNKVVGTLITDAIENILHNVFTTIF